MAYFPNAYQQTFILNELATLGDTTTLGSGNGGFFDAKTWNIIPLAQASVTQHPRIVFAAGPHRLTAGDKLGSHGGYKESLKSRVIDPNYVHRFWKVDGNPVQAHIVQLGFDGTDDATTPTFYCGQTYHLRIDVKGSPALRLLDHTIYHTFDVRTACCPSTTTDPQLVDPVQVLLAFAKQINESSIVSKFLTATVESFGSPVDGDTYVPETSQGAMPFLQASLKLTAGYSDTQFAYFSFDPRDHYELEPVIISSAQLLDDTGDPCSLFKQLTFTQVQAPLAAQGSGETVMREFILNNEYRQDSFPWDARKKDLFDFPYIAGALTIPFFTYDSYYILYSTPRKYNPSGTYDNDLCLLRFCAESGGGGALLDLEAWFTAYLNSTGSGVTLENLSV